MISVCWLNANDDGIAIATCLLMRCFYFLRDSNCKTGLEPGVFFIKTSEQ